MLFVVVFRIVLVYLLIGAALSVLVLWNTGGDDELTEDAPKSSWKSHLAYTVVWPLFLWNGIL